MTRAAEFCWIAKGPQGYLMAMVATAGQIVAQWTPDRNLALRNTDAGMTSIEKRFGLNRSLAVHAMGA